LGFRSVAACFLAAVAVTAGAQTSSTAVASHPNVVMIFTDDMGFADISSFAKSDLKVKTPNIDRLAKEGMKFTQFYVAMPICSPSRASVLSGRFAPETGLTSFLHERKGNRASDQNDYMEPSLSHLPKSFQAAGYATAHVGKWHLGGGRDVDNAPRMKEYGYDEAYVSWEGPKADRDPQLGINHAPWDPNRKDPGQVDRHDRTRHMVDRTLDFMKRNASKPTFVTLWPDDLHTPFRPGKEMAAKYNAKPDDRSIENFHAVLEEYDRQVGRLLDGLKAQGQDANTIVFFTGDNGPAPPYGELRTDGMRGMKLSLYEGGIREPFIIRWPGRVPADVENSETVMCATDLLPTLTKLAGIQMTDAGKQQTDGEDLSAAVLGQPMKRKTPLLWEYGRTAKVPRAKGKDKSPGLAIRQGDLKLLINPDYTGPQLYNVAKDPNEKRNLADKHPEQVQQMAKTVVDWSKTLPHRTQP